MIIINNHIERAASFKLTIPVDEICRHVVNNKTGDFLPIAKIINDWAHKKFEAKKITIKYADLFGVTKINDGEVKNCLRIEGHIYGGKSGNDVSMYVAKELGEELEEFLKKYK